MFSDEYDKLSYLLIYDMYVINLLASTFVGTLIEKETDRNTQGFGSIWKTVRLAILIIKRFIHVGEWMSE